MTRETCNDMITLAVNITGCIPSKLLIHSAGVAEIIKRANLFGIEVHGYDIEFEKIVERVNSITDSESDEIKSAFEGIDNPKLFPKGYKFIGPKTIRISEDSDSILTAEKVLIAAYPQWCLCYSPLCLKYHLFLLAQYVSFLSDSLAV